MMQRPLLVLAMAGLVAACGARAPLEPKPGSVLPVQGETNATRHNADQLMAADTQARPKRSDEQLKRSEERREDKFDLPPT